MTTNRTHGGTRGSRRFAAWVATIVGATLLPTSGASAVTDSTTIDVPAVSVEAVEVGPGRVDMVFTIDFPSAATSTLFDTEWLAFAIPHEGVDFLGRAPTIGSLPDGTFEMVVSGVTTAFGSFCGGFPPFLSDCLSPVTLAPGESAVVRVKLTHTDLGAFCLHGLHASVMHAVETDAYSGFEPLATDSTHLCEVADEQGTDRERRSPRLEVDAGISDTDAAPGDRITWTYTVTNTGDTALNGIELVETRTTVTSTADGVLGALDVGTVVDVYEHVVARDVSLGEGESETYTVTRRIDEDDLPGPMTTTITATGFNRGDAYVDTDAVELVLRTPAEDTSGTPDSRPVQPDPVTPAPEDASSDGGAGDEPAAPNAPSDDAASGDGVTAAEVLGVTEERSAPAGAPASAPASAPLPATGTPALVVPIGLALVTAGMALRRRPD